MEKPYLCNERAAVRNHIHKKGMAAILEIFTTLYHSHMYKCILWQCMITVDYMYLAIAFFLLSVSVACYKGSRKKKKLIGTKKIGMN